MNNLSDFISAIALGGFGYFVGKKLYRSFKRDNYAKFPEKMYKDADLLLKAGKIRKGFSVLNKLIQNHPDYMDAYLLRAKVSLDMQKPLGNSIKDLSLFLEKSPDSADAYQTRAQAYMRVEKLDDALNDINNAIDLEPEIGKYYSVRSVIYFIIGDIDKAFNDVAIGIDLGDKLSGYEFRAILYGSKKEYDLAIADMTSAIQISPEIGKYYFWRGVWYEEMGNLDMARLNLELGLKKGLQGKLYSSAKELLEKI